MTVQIGGKLNWLVRHLPEGLLVDARWLSRYGYSTSLRSQYVAAGWLEQPTRRVYCRPRGSLSWQQVVISLQALLEYPIVVGGRTALEAQGHAHYLAHEAKEVHLYGSKAPPRWLSNLPLKVRFIYHNDQKLFAAESIAKAPTRFKGENDRIVQSRTRQEGWTVQSSAPWDWPMALSTPERAILELLDEVPQRESFHQVHMFMQNLFNLSPRHLQALLRDCRSIKVKRLFFFFADQHRHAWLKRLDKRAIDLGEGKRMLVKGGKLDKTYQITVPADLDGVR